MPYSSCNVYTLLFKNKQASYKELKKLFLESFKEEQTIRHHNNMGISKKKAEPKPCL
jgi:hypothetical protein